MKLDRCKDSPNEKKKKKELDQQQEIDKYKDALKGGVLHSSTQWKEAF